MSTLRSIPAPVESLLGSDALAHLVTLNPDGTQLIAVYRRERRSTRNTTTDSSSTTNNPNKKEQ